MPWQNSQHWKRFDGLEDLLKGRIYPRHAGLSRNDSREFPP